MRMSDDLRDFDKKKEVPKHKTDLADEITQALGINGVYVSVSLTNEEMHLNKLDFSEHDKVFEDKIAELKKDYKTVSGLLSDYQQENESLKQRIAELESKETEKPTKINLNDRIKVKLTPLGAEIYYHQYDDIHKDYPKMKKHLQSSLPKVDENGYTEFQLWHFIELYGERIGMCKKNVIEPLDIIIAE